ncbi:low molecular weight phosphatase family protein [Blastococcus saxobsidens]|uniref:Protein-tyrosine phosphatase n=1 Tax=Blastococcus saxobsidens TaxID=138336 RepID=A0A4V2G2U0_9ACTN|nr:low molecular weight phosphatase family protein [Blastococcus saxobsidens]RZU34456.1 protein-tyrosine phosphatase [Blastococcus saxobsidens]
MSGTGVGPLLVVCTGNICRSPAAELLLRAGLGDDAGIAVASAGLDARAGEPLAPPTARLLAARGLEPGGFVARQLEPALLRTAGVVLTMTRAQRSAVVAQAPATVRRAFTLHEFAGLARLSGALAGDGGPAGRLSALVAAAPRLRALRTGARDDDIEDPYRRSEETFVRVLTRIESDVATLLDVLTPGFVSDSA